jgi:peptidoglycan endopeptidase LytE
MSALRHVVFACLACVATIAMPHAAHADSASSGSTGSYTVSAGDSWYRIAQRHGVSVTALVRVNDREITSVLLPGQHLELPAGATTPTPATTSSAATSGASTGSYTVVAGDSWYRIAQRHGVSVTALLRVNDREITSVLLPGQHLELPAGATTPTPATTRPAATSTESRELDAVLAYARQQLGKPYRFFTRGPDTFDCSGLTTAAYSEVGITLTHYSAAQALQGKAVDFEHESIQPGDLIFQKRHGSTLINHVGMALDATTWIQATGPGDTVRIGRIPPTSTIAAVRRIIDG